MASEIQSVIADEFNGYESGAVFQLDNGRIFQQTSSLYSYRYAYRPRVRVFLSNGGLALQIDGMPQAVSVIEVSILEQGAIVSDFKGFDGNSLFQFENGHVWKQREYKYNYHYAYRPSAIVVDGINGTEIHIQGMSESVGVTRIK